jgi:hypothetical protein
MNPSRHITILEVTKGTTLGLPAPVDPENREHIG